MRRTSLAPKRWAETAALVAMTLLGLSQIGARSTADASTVLSFGANSEGQTGQGIDTGFTPIATPIDTTNLIGNTITQLAAGWNHNLLLADDGTVFSFGWNVFGQAGLGTTENALVATPIDTTNLTGKTVSQVAAGRDHSLVLASDGTVFSFGSNDVGRTGLGTNLGITTVASPINSTNLVGTSIRQVAAGRHHSLLLTTGGAVFSFGTNLSGRTGLGTDFGYTLVATPIDTTNLTGKAITQVAAGDQHSLLLADDGTVFAFGNNNNGRTGLGLDGGNTLIATPIDITNLAGKSIAQIAAGAQHSLLLADDGTVFAFGRNAFFGATGLGTDVGTTTIATPIDTTNLAGKTITQVAAGLWHNLLLADDGTVFAFGRNLDGATGLGIGSDTATVIATPIDSTNLTGLRATGVSAGALHSLLLAEPEPGLPGDFNDDGKVDAADYVLWRKTGGSQDDYETWHTHFGESTVNITPGDFNDDGKVDAADYVVWRKTDGTAAGYNEWRTNFGHTFATGSGSTLRHPPSPLAPAVPEPATGLLFCFAAAAARCLCRRWR